MKELNKFIETFPKIKNYDVDEKSNNCERPVYFILKCKYGKVMRPIKYVKKIISSIIKK